jgi:hypothetical protein
MATCSSEVDSVSRYRRDVCGLVLGLAFSSAACTAAPIDDVDLPEPEGGDCVPGTQLACACADGSSGITTCNATGQTSRTCTCRDAHPGDDAGAPPDPIGDASTGTETKMPTERATAYGVRIARLAMYQSVAVPLMQDGQAVINRNAPIVIGKAALLRVFVEPLPGFVPRDLLAVLDLVSAGGHVRSLESSERVQLASTDVGLETTFNFEIPPQFVTGDVRYAVSLHEVNAAPQPGSVDARARWPEAEGSLDTLGARTAGVLRVMLVPYRYMADGSGRMPVTDETELQRYRDRLGALYPASEIQLELHAPVDYPDKVAPESGWNEWLDAHCELRASEHPDPKVLYYGTMSPAESWLDYGGGIVGISNVPGPASNYGRCSVGVGFPGAQSTMAHELGHALGLPHAPCGTAGGPFPYPDGKIGVWGFALSTRTLKDPSLYYDVMSYCEPSFISDFNFQRLFERIRYLNLEFARTPAPTPQRYVRVLVAEDGSTKVRGSSVLNEPPGGEEEAHVVNLLDEHGRTLSQAEAYFLPFSNEGAGVWLIPDTGAAAAYASDFGTIGLLR